MNPPITFPPASPVLKLSRPPADKWAVSLAEERRRLEEDMDALREREANLREYEARLRALQAELDAGRNATVPGPAAVPATAAGAAARRSSGSVGPFARAASRTPFAETAEALPSAWEKLHRARELLEAEQAHLRNDRIAQRECEAQLKRREDAVAEREARVAEREAWLAANLPAPKPAARAAAAVEEESAVSRLTTAPFKFASAVLRGKK